MADVTAFGTIFTAFGCKLNYDSANVRLEVISSPKSRISDRAISDILSFDDTTNYIDGAAALVIAETIDGERNPIKERVRTNVLEGLGITHNGKYIYQVLSLQKNNRAWHFSDVPNACSNFYDTCTHRGVNPDPERKGKRSNRKPEEYHTLDGHGNVRREQLVTPALETLFRNIPEENLISGRQPVSINLDLKNLKKLPIDEKLRIISGLQESIA